MNDTEVLTWVAEHLDSLILGVGNVDIGWIDDNGDPQKKTFQVSRDESDVETLRHCVTAIAAP